MGQDSSATTKFGMVTHIRKGWFWGGISHASEYCTNASRGLSATAQLVLFMLLSSTMHSTCTAITDNKSKAQYIYWQDGG